jgi:hypothetical protein
MSVSVTTLSLLTEYHSAHVNEIMWTEDAQNKHHLLWVGNSNRHHPYWDALENNSLFTCNTTNQVEILIQVLAEVGLEMALAVGIPTHKHSVTKRWSRLDHVFVTKHTIKAIDQCKALPEEQGINTDHFLIITQLNLVVVLAPTMEVRNYREVDWKEFRDKLSEKLDGWGVPNFIKTQSELNHTCTRFTNIIQEMITNKVPKAKIGPHSKSCWTKELTELRHSMLKDRRKAHIMPYEPTNPFWEQFKEARHTFSRELDKAKCNHWRDWLEKSTDPDIWTAHKYISAPPGDSSKTRIPDLTYLVSGEQTKASTKGGKGANASQNLLTQQTRHRHVNATQEQSQINLQGGPINQRADKKGPSTSQAVQSAWAGQYSEYHTDQVR